MVLVSSLSREGTKPRLDLLEGDLTLVGQAQTVVYLPVKMPIEVSGFMVTLLCSR